MSEPFLPVPPPERNDEYWDPEPPRCPECGDILGTLEDDEGVAVGRCQFHGMVEPVYSDSQSENEEDDE
jgi:hypothetical protein